MEIAVSGDVGGDSEGIELKERTSATGMKRPLLDGGVTVDNEDDDLSAQPLPSIVGAVAGKQQQQTTVEGSGGVEEDGEGGDPHLDLGGAKSGIVGATLNQVKAIVGVGVLSLPYAIMQTGPILGVVALVFAVVVVGYTMHLVVKVKDEVNLGRVGADRITQYDLLAKHVLGTWGHGLAVGSILGTQIGIGCAYVLFVANQIHSLVPMVSVTAWIFILGPVLFGLVAIRNLRNLSPFSLFAIVAIFVSLFTVLYYGFAHEGLHPLPLVPLNPFLVIGTLIFSFEGINLAIPVHESMEKPHDYGKVLVWGFFGVTSVFLAFGVLGFSFWLYTTKPIITLNLTNDWVVIIVKAALIFEVLLTYPVQLFPCVLYFERLLLRVPEERSCANFRTALFWKRNLVRAAMVLFTLSVSAAIPMFEIVTNIVGGLGNGLSGFVIPGLLYLSLHKGRLPTWSLILHWGIVALGSAVAVAVTVVSIFTVIERLTSPQQE